MTDKKSEQKNIILCASIYHLFVALMVIYSKGIEDKTYLLLTTHEASQFEHFQILQPKIQKIGIPCEARLRNKKHELLGLEARKTKKQYSEVVKKIGTDKYHFINFSWNFSGPFRTSISWYKAADTVEFFEEGAMCMNTPPDKIWKQFFKRCIGIRSDFYMDKKLESIHVQKAEFFPKEYVQKMVHLDLKALADVLDDRAKFKILSVFLQENEIEQINSLRDKTEIVVFTQPLSEDSYISEQHKISLYGTICEKLSKYGKIIVKLHPRDKTDYRINKVSVNLEAGYPSELLLLFPVKFSMAVGICTSAVISCNAEKGINLCNDYLKTLDDSFLNSIDEMIHRKEYWL